MGAPVLWHIPVSHFNEKVRWALDLKGVEHERRAPMPPSHMAVAMWLTRGASKTFPVLSIDGRAIGDSTEIIAELERRHPDPPLYPEDPVERRRALELEDFFDEELAPHSRLLGFHELGHNPEAQAEFTANLLPGPLAGNPSVRKVAGKGVSAFADARYRAGDEQKAETARTKIHAALDRLEAELDRDGSGYLAGGWFSVADLTAASLFVPVVAPPEGPSLPQPSPSYEAFLAPLRERPGFRWVAGIFARHRGHARRP